MLQDHDYFCICFFLDQDESHHLINVLRLKINSNIWLTDGEGGTYYSKVDTFTHKNIVEGSIVEYYTNQNIKPCFLDE